MDGDEAEWVEPGNSVICNPNGEIVAGPLRYGEEGILTTAVDLDRLPRRDACSTRSVTHRPDVFQLTVDTRPRRVRLISEDTSATTDAVVGPLSILAQAEHVVPSRRMRPATGSAKCVPMISVSESANRSMELAT